MTKFVLSQRVLVLCLTLMPVGAVAGAWQQFEKHCLAPLEAATLTQPTTLPEVSRYKNDGDLFNTYALDGDAMLWVSYGRADYAQWCAIHSTIDVEDFIRAFENWVENPDPEQGYVALLEADMAQQPEITLRGVRSTDWREPLLDVVLSVPDSGAWVSVRVEDTDLES